MGYAMMVSECGACHQIFCYNPHLVPSLNNVPFCKRCVDASAPERIKRGLVPIKYSEEAYKPMDECEL
jgi:hypothetical protein